MKTDRINNWKHALVIIILSVFVFPPTLRAGNKSKGNYKHHQYVYYPKQNFYYDPYASNYIIVEKGVWRRQVQPPQAVARININVLPHVDVYVDSYEPYKANKRHKQKFSLMRYMSPPTTFYVYRLPLSYDFSITAYQYYRPAGNVVFVNYDPNQHHYHGYGRNHGPHPDFHFDGPHGPKGYGPKGHGPKEHGNGSWNNGNKHNPGDFHQKGNKPNKGGGKPAPSQNNDKHPGDFHQNNGDDRKPGDFHQKNVQEKNQPTQQNDRKPGDFHSPSKGGQPSGPGKGGNGHGKKGGH